MASAIHFKAPSGLACPLSIPSLPTVRLPASRRLKVFCRRTLAGSAPCVKCLHAVTLSGLRFSRNHLLSAEQRTLYRCGSSRESEATNANAEHDTGDEKDWIQLLALLFTAGLAMGPPLDGIHSRVQLQIYDNAPLVIGAAPVTLYTSLWVFPLLGAFYAVGGALHPLLDGWLAPEKHQSGLLGHDWPVVALNFGTLAALLELSAALYSANLPFDIVFLILGTCALINWWVFERTWWGLALAALIALSAPAAETVLMRLFNVWHYPRADVTLAGQGVVSWVIWCYFFYTPSLGKLARRLLNKQHGRAGS